MAEALKRAFEANPDTLLSPGVTAEDLLPGIRKAAVAAPGVVFDPSHAQNHQESDKKELPRPADGELSGEDLDELIEVMRLPGSSKRKGVIRQQTEQELPPETTIKERGSRVAGRTRINASLREVSTIATEQRTAEIEQQRQVQAQADQERQREQVRQERVAAREREKEQRRQDALQAQAEAAARREQKAKDSDTKREAKKAAQAAQPRRADIERQRRATQQPIQAPARKPSRSAEQQPRDLEALKGQYTQLGGNLFLLMLYPAVATFRGVTREKLQEQWESAIKETQKLPIRQQMELIHCLSAGMKLTETGADDTWVKAARNSGADPSQLYPSDYLLYGTSYFFYDNPLEDADDFHAFVTGRRRIDGPGLIAAEKTILDWAKSHPQ